MKKISCNEKLNSELSMKKNQLKMLNNTIDEMIERDFSAESIEKVRMEADNTIREIMNIKKHLTKPEFREESGRCIYTPYDYKDEQYYNSPYYESVVKQTKANMYAQDLAEKYNGCDDYPEDELDPHTCMPRYTSYTESVGGLCSTGDISANEENKINSMENKYLDEINANVDLFSRQNNFLVKFSHNKTMSNLNSWLVRSVEFSSKDSNTLNISLYDTLVEVNGTKKPLIDVLKKIKNNKDNEFTITISNLDPFNRLLYNEEYRNCKIMDVDRSSRDYSKDDFSSINIEVYYKYVDYYINAGCMPES